MIFTNVSLAILFGRNIEVSKQAEFRQTVFPLSLVKRYKNPELDAVSRACCGLHVISLSSDWLILPAVLVMIGQFLFYHIQSTQPWYSRGVCQSLWYNKTCNAWNNYQRDTKECIFVAVLSRVWQTVSCSTIRPKRRSITNSCPEDLTWRKDAGIK